MSENTIRSVRVRASELEGQAWLQHRRQKPHPAGSSRQNRYSRLLDPLLHQLPAVLDELRPLEEEFSLLLRHRGRTQLNSNTKQTP